MSPNVICPICSRPVPERDINEHLDSGCSEVISSRTPIKPTASTGNKISISKSSSKSKQDNVPLAPIFGKSGPSQAQVSSSYDAPVSTPSRASSSKRQSDALFFEPSTSHNQIPASYGQGSSNKRAKTSTSNLENAQPLAERLRPQSLNDFVGQPHLTGPNSLLRHLLESGRNMGSIVFWGPPGCGKTTLARLLANKSGAVFKELSATGSGINDVRKVFEEAKGLLAMTGRKTILFLDEIHRFNKAQQDIFLPYVEQGHIQLIGATTENPSFRVNGALLSRCRVFVLERLTDDDIKEIITRAIARIDPSSGKIDNIYPENAILSDDTIPSSEISTNLPSSQPGSSQTTSVTLLNSSPSSDTLPFPTYPQISSKVFNALISLSTGDARTALSLLSLALSAPPDTPTSSLIESLRTSVINGYDRTGDAHYDLISALHKSVRGSAGSAALYWLARMLKAGEDPLYIARRMVVCASEDIGLADSQALPLAMATYQACQVIGMPECRIHLAHLVSYLSEAPKSTRSYRAYQRAEAAAEQDMTLPVPLPLRNAPTRLMADLGYAEGYRYNPDYKHPVYNQYLPNQFKNETFLLKEGNLSDREWNEEALKVWEAQLNDGKEWEGRKDLCNEDIMTDN